jgi:Putative 2OG-Fe(II) oxygenase
MDSLEEHNYFATTIYAVEKAEFLEPIRSISNKYLEDSKSQTGKKMTVMTENFSNDPEALGFAQYVSQSAWNILASQGYAMDGLVTYFTEMWTQEHNFQSNMEQHFHGGGAQISAFYFLEVPDKGCKLIIYDPRQSKVIINLPQADDDKLTPASPYGVFSPKEGVIIFTPAWLPHSFSRNLNSEKPMKFVHMNISVAPAPEPEVEII